MLHSVSPISLSTTYLNLDMLMYSICPVPLALIGDRLFVRFWGGYLYHFLIEVGYSRFPNAPKTQSEGQATASGTTGNP